MSKESNKTKQTQLSVIVAIWLAVLLSIGMLTRANQENYSSVEELGHTLEQLRSTLYFDTQYRIAHASDISLKVQLIYSLRLQLESNYDNGFFQPDINQLIFTTDRFIELVKQFNQTEAKVVQLVEQLKNLRESYQGTPEIQALYYQLSSRVFEAMFTTGSISPEIYRSLDYLFVQSQLMPSKDGKNLQQALAQTSSVLGGYARGSYLVDRIVNHPVNILQSELKHQYTELTQLYFIIVVVVSALALFFLSLIVITKHNPETVDVGPETVDSEMSQKASLGQDMDRTARHPNDNIMVPNATSSAVIIPNDNISTATMSNDEQAVNSKTSNHFAPTSSPSSEVDIDFMLQALDDDKESVLLLLNVFIDDHKDDANKLSELLQSDTDHAMRVAHSLKGVSANLGAKPLNEISTQIEFEIKNKIIISDEKQKRLFTELAATIASARQYIKSQQFS